MLMPFVYLGGFLALLLIIIFGATLSRVMSVRVRSLQGPRRVDPLDVPLDALMLLQEKGRELEALGFEACGALEEDFFIAGVEEPTWTLLYRHPAGRSFALLALAAAPTRAQGFDLTLCSCSADGSLLETVSYRAHMMPPGLPNHLLVDAETLAFEEQWQKHQAALAEYASFDALALEASALVDRLRDFRRTSHEHQVATARYVPCRDGSYRFGLKWALAEILRSNKGESARLRALAAFEKKQKDRSSGAPGGAPPPSGDMTAELAAHQQREAVERNRNSGWPKKLLFFVVSVGLFAVAFGIQLSLETVLLLFAVLLFHELGHVLAMRAVGYRDLQILFIPFLGAAATGRKRDVRPYEEIIVLLAGPVPGIALGTLIVVTGWAGEIAWLGSAAFMMLFLNYLNLLPIVPLDGGRIVSIALFDRFPRLQLVFSALSGIVILLCGRAFNEPILLGLGILLLVGVPAQLTQSRILARARAWLRTRRQSEGIDESDLIRSIYLELQKPKFDRWNSETKHQMVNGILGRLKRKPAGWRVVVASLFAYFVAMTLPVGFIAYKPAASIVAAMREANEEYERQVAEWEPRIEAAASDDERARVLQEAGQHFYESDYHEEAYGYLERASELLQGGAQPEIEAKTRLLLGQIWPYWREDLSEEQIRRRATQHLDRALALREMRFGSDSLEVAEVLEAFLPLEGDDFQKKLERSARLVSIYEKALPGDPSVAWNLVSAHQTGGLMLTEIGQHEEAEAELLQALAVADAADPAARAALQGDALTMLSEFYFARRRYEEVRSILQRREALRSGDPDADPFSGFLLDLDRAWLAYWDGDYAEARSRFSALRERSEQASSETGAFGMAETGVASIPQLMNLATVAQRSGDTQEALRLLSQARGIVEDRLEQPLAVFLESQLPVDAGDAPPPNFGDGWRRQAEQARVLRPLIARL